MDVLSFCDGFNNHHIGTLRCRQEGASTPSTEPVELELIDRERRMVERRIKAAKFPATKSLDSFDVKAIPKLNSEPANATGSREQANAGAGTRPLRMDPTARERHHAGGMSST